MPRQNPTPGSVEGLDYEIELLRGLIAKAAEKQTEKLSFEDQLSLLETVGKTAPALARLLKARRELANQALDPAALLRQSLLELEEEWPELKKFGEQFRRRKQVHASAAVTNAVASTTVPTAAAVETPPAAAAPPAENLPSEHASRVQIEKTSDFYG